MSQEKRKSFSIKIAVAVAAAAVFVTFFAIPFRFNISDYGKNYSPIVPWFTISEEYNYFLEPSNPPLIGDWDFPVRSVNRKLIFFGKECRSDLYVEYEDGRRKKI